MFEKALDFRKNIYSLQYQDFSSNFFQCQIFSQRYLWNLVQHLGSEKVVFAYQGFGFYITSLFGVHISRKLLEPAIRFHGNT